MYQLGLVLMSTISLIAAQYVVDGLLAWLSPGGYVYAVQLIPEAKIIIENVGKSSDRQPFAYNYLSFSIGFGVVLAFGLVYALISRLLHTDGQRYRAPWLRFGVIATFYFVAVMSYLKPYIHMDPGFHLNVNRNVLMEKFRGLDMATPAVGLSFGILAYNVCMN
jgi:hypothetical protein